MSGVLIKKAENLLLQCKVCSVASVSEEGYPRICVLMPLKTNGIKEFWFSTGASGTKVRHFKKNGKAGVTFYCGGDSVTLTGEMEIVSDKNVKDALWRDELGRHFTGGGKDDPEYCILHFTAIEATVYIDGAFETLKI
ncbi:MAG: pyridoxamine 5'-phosphate oxidase family protein [Candidatus Scatosoma sp.]